MLPKIPLHCGFCDFTCASNDDMNQHYNCQHDSKPPPLLKCNHCEFSHAERTEIEFHSLKMHGKHFFCVTCGKFMGPRETWANHCAKSKQCQREQVMTICKLCDKDFPNWHKLQKHKLSKHTG